MRGTSTKIVVASVYERLEHSNFYGSARRLLSVLGLVCMHLGCEVITIGPVDPCKVKYPALQTYPRLACCILLCRAGVDDTETTWLPESRDIRFLKMVTLGPDACQADWQYGVIGVEDMWASAE
jgi:hypothetical protein